MENLICRKCNNPVIVQKDSYEIFEHMHWICFHFEFEHINADPTISCDPDEACADMSCPWHRIKFLETVIKKNNIEIDDHELVKYYEEYKKLN